MGLFKISAIGLLEVGDTRQLSGDGELWSMRAGM
jgi:acetamidase/formamidase